MCQYGGVRSITNHMLYVSKEDLSPAVVLKKEKTDDDDYKKNNQRKYN